MSSLLDVGDVLLRAIHNQAGPVVVQQQETGVGFGVILHPELDELLYRDVEPVHQVLDDAVVPPLGKDLEFGLSKLRQPTGIPDFMGEQPAGQNPGVGGSSAMSRRFWAFKFSISCLSD